MASNDQFNFSLGAQNTDVLSALISLHQQAQSGGYQVPIVGNIDQQPEQQSPLQEGSAEKVGHFNKS